MDACRPAYVRRPTKGTLNISLYVFLTLWATISVTYTTRTFSYRPQAHIVRSFVSFQHKNSPCVCVCVCVCVLRSVWVSWGQDTVVNVNYVCECLLSCVSSWPRHSSPSSLRVWGTRLVGETDLPLCCNTMWFIFYWGRLPHSALYNMRPVG